MAQKNTVKKKTVKSSVQADKEARMPLTPYNYKLMLIGFAAIVVGFILMSGGKVEDPTTFSYDMFSFRRITLAPLVVVAGFAFELYAIMAKDKRREKGE